MANTTSNDISTFKIDNSTGALTGFGLSTDTVELNLQSACGFAFASVGECEEPTPRHTAIQGFGTVPRKAGNIDQPRASTRTHEVSPHLTAHLGPTAQ
jgi:hypothetical protein